MYVAKVKNKQCCVVLSPKYFAPKNVCVGWGLGWVVSHRELKFSQTFRLNLKESILELYMGV